MHRTRATLEQAPTVPGAELPARWSPFVDSAELRAEPELRPVARLVTGATVERRRATLPASILDRLPPCAREGPCASWTFAAYLQRPPWYDPEAVRAIYREAERRRARGEDVAVDHVVPLQGNDVSGLHCAENLRIVRRRVNASKSNRGILYRQLSWLGDEPEPYQLALRI